MGSWSTTRFLGATTIQSKVRTKVPPQFLLCSKTYPWQPAHKGTWQGAGWCVWGEPTLRGGTRLLAAGSSCPEKGRLGTLPGRSKSDSSIPPPAQEQLERQNQEALQLESSGGKTGVRVSSGQGTTSPYSSTESPHTQPCLKGRQIPLGEPQEQLLGMVEPAGGDIMAGMQKEESLEASKGTEPRVLPVASQSQVEALTGSQAPNPRVQALSSSAAAAAAAVRNVNLHQPQKRDLIRSLGRGSRGSGNWEVSSDTARLSIGRGSTRRRGLKEILLQSSGAEGAMWLVTAQKIASSSSLAVEMHQELEQRSEQSPDDLSLALDPLEHEWMLTVAQGDTESLLRLLDIDPSLLGRRDFVTGFTALHWLAKHGFHEALIEVMTCAEKKGCHVDVNIPTASGGLTPLHLAALQGHEMVIKVLVGAYSANTSLRDHSGRKAWQYLREDASRELKELSGALEEDLAQLGAWNINNNCKPSRQAGGSDADRTSQVFRRLPSFRNMFRQALAFFQEL
ncbi:ankyrin repeat domain-containing protein SOWAHD [Emydura macquarii macquarii]|uniref:ankyrin repeat domain-containing protein SOWAHD n=1 Tax=Emydura macquarii macquarii TaxID=1129001 RepID=UPI00352BB253